MKGMNMIFSLDLALFAFSTIALFTVDNIIAQSGAALLFGWSAYGVYHSVRGE